MAIILTDIQDYISLNPELLLLKQYEDLTIRRAMVYDVSNVVPGPFESRFIEANGNLQACCQRPSNPSRILKRMSECVCIMDGDDYCETDLARILSNAVAEAQRVRFTAGQEQAGALEHYFINAHRTAFVDALEVLSWQGDKDDADTNLNRVDGLLKIARTGQRVVDYTSGNVFDMIQRGIRTLPREARRVGKEGIGVFVPEDVADAYFYAAMFMNLYHYRPDENEFGKDRNAIGFPGITIIPTRGLNGTSSIVITPVRNIVWFNSRQDDHNTMDWDYDKRDQVYYWRVKTIFGVDMVRPELAVVVDFDDDILEQSTGMPVSLVSPNPLAINIAAPLTAGGQVATADGGAVVAPAGAPLSAPAAAKATKTTVKSKKEEVK